MKKTALISLAVIMSLIALGNSTRVSANIFGIDFDAINRQMAEVARQAAEAVRQAHCTDVKGKIGVKMDGFQTIYSAHLSKYNDLKSKLSEMIIDIDEKGYNVTDLRADYRELNSKIDKLKVDFAVFRIRVSEAKDGMCRGTTTEDQVKDKLADARSILRSVKSDSKDIKNYYKNKIKPDILEVKEQRYVED